MNAPKRAGTWMFVCGPSGSGKDSVIACAQRALVARKDIVFAQRFVSRPAHPGSDHVPLTELAFDALLQADGLCWHWQAHGFSYGIARRYEDAFHAGCVVVVNGSREHVSTLPPSSGVRVVHIRADQNALAGRLLRRGRDTATTVALRLARNTGFEGMHADRVIDNDAELAQAGRQLAEYLQESAA